MRIFLAIFMSAALFVSLMLLIATMIPADANPVVHVMAGFLAGGIWCGTTALIFKA